MDWRDAKQQLLKKKALREAYEQIDLKYEIGRMVSDARIAKKMTQKVLAEHLGTQQPSIARLERGSYLPSLVFLQKLAEVFDTQLLPPQFEFLETRRVTLSHTVKLANFFEDVRNHSAISSRWSVGESTCTYNPPIVREGAIQYA